MKVVIVKDKEEELTVLGFEPENDDEEKTLKELWDLNHISLRRASYKEIKKKMKYVVFWMDKVE